jgi:hypothetical protein
VSGFALDFFPWRNKSIPLPHKLFGPAALRAIFLYNLFRWFTGSVSDFFHGISKGILGLFNNKVKGNSEIVFKFGID